MKFDPDKEDLRDGLFFNIFQKAILFDDLDKALAYREYLVKSGLPIPTMYTRQGDLITSRAFLNPRNNARCPRDLDFVFGESDKSNQELHSLKAGKISNYRPHFNILMIFLSVEIEMIKSRINLIEDRVKFSQELAKFSNIDEIRTEMEKLREAIREL